MQKPNWADEIINEVMLLNGRSKPPKIVWRHKAYGYRGFARYRYDYRKNKIVFSYISISFNGDEKSGKLILLHELTHWLCPRKWKHNIKFWTKAWGLYHHFKSQLDWEQVKRSEFAYKDKAKIVFERLGY